MDSDTVAYPYLEQQILKDMSRQCLHRSCHHVHHCWFHSAAKRTFWVLRYDLLFASFSLNYLSIRKDHLASGSWSIRQDLRHTYKIKVINYPCKEKQTYIYKNLNVYGWNISKLTFLPALIMPSFPQFFHKDWIRFLHALKDK